MTGIDLTPGDAGTGPEESGRGQGLTNITWQHGDVLPLPYAGRAFTIVTSRFAFHHFLDPERC